MTIKSTTRAPRKTKVSQVIESVEAEGSEPNWFEKSKADDGCADISGKRYIASLAVSLLSGFTLGYFVVGPVLEAFVVGAMTLGWPAFIILIGYMLLLAIGLYLGSKVCQLPVKAVLERKVDAMYFVARDKVRGLFNFRNEVIA